MCVKGVSWGNTQPYLWGVLSPLCSQLSLPRALITRHKENEYDVRATRVRQVDRTRCSLQVPGLIEKKFFCRNKNVTTLAFAKNSGDPLPLLTGSQEIDLNLH